MMLSIEDQTPCDQIAAARKRIEAELIAKGLTPGKKQFERAMRNKLRRVYKDMK